MSDKTFKGTAGEWFVWEPETQTGSGSDERATGIVIGRGRRNDITQEIATINCESMFFENVELVPVQSGLLKKEYWPKAPVEALANAKLIAASPTLLEALMNTYCSTCGYRAGMDWHEKIHGKPCLVCKDARAAISKALD